MVRLNKLVILFLLVFCFLGVIFAQDSEAKPSLEPAEPVGPSTSNVETGAAATSLDKANNPNGFSLGNLDFSEARISLAGPSALYIRSVKVDGNKVSLLFRKDSDEQWKLVDTIPEEKNFFSSGTILDFARVSKLDNGSLELDGIVLDGKPYKTIVKMNPDNSLSFAEPMQTGSFIGSSLTRAKPAAGLALKDELEQLDTITKKYDESERVNQEMLSKIGNLEVTNKSSSEEKQKLIDQLKELEDRNSALGTEVDSLKTEIEGYKATIAQANANAKPGDNPAPVVQQYNDEALRKILATLSTSVDALQEKVGGLDKKLDKISDQAVSNIRPVSNDAVKPSGNADLDALQAEIKRLSDLNQQLMNERQDLERNLRQKFIASGYIQTFKPLLTHMDLSSFASASSKVGNWKVSDKLAIQPDAGQYFAQLNLPLVQQNKTMLYRFSAKSTGKGWVGIGLHIYAQDSTKKGYGHGKSILVWLTRDPDYYKTNRTYLQLYKSDDDINMGRVLDSAIEESIGQDMNIEVLYQPQEEYIAVAINGVEKIRYKTWFGLTDGIEVALRSLGTAEFHDLEVLSEGK